MAAVRAKSAACNRQSQLANRKFIWLVIQVPAFASAADSVFRFSARQNIWNAAITVRACMVRSPAASTRITASASSRSSKLLLTTTGLLERQFRGVYEKALRRRGVTGRGRCCRSWKPVSITVVYHLGLANTRAAARQMVWPRPHPGEWPQGQCAVLQPQGERRHRRQKQ